MKLAMILLAESTRRLHFDYDSADNEKVGAEHADNMAMIFDVERVFPNIWETALGEFDLERASIHTFEKAVAELVVDRIEGADDLPGGVSLEKVMRVSVWDDLHDP